MISESHKGEPTEARGSPLIVDSALNLRGAIRAAVEAGGDQGFSSSEGRQHTRKPATAWERVVRTVA
jgi:hypothetical protein